MHKRRVQMDGRTDGRTKEGTLRGVGSLLYEAASACNKILGVRGAEEAARRHRSQRRTDAFYFSLSIFFLFVCFIVCMYLYIYICIYLYIYTQFILTNLSLLLQFRHLHAESSVCAVVPHLSLLFFFCLFYYYIFVVVDVTVFCLFF